MRHALRIKMLFRAKVKHLIHKIDKEERQIEALQKHFEEYTKEGLVESVINSLREYEEREANGETFIFEFEENTLLNWFDEFKPMYKNLNNFKHVEYKLKEDLRLYSPETQKLAKEIFGQIITILRKELDETFDMMLQFARAFRDQYEATIKTGNHEEAHERLREMIVGVQFKGLVESLNISGAHRAARRLTKDIHESDKYLHEIEELLLHMEKARENKPSEEKFIKDLKRLKEIISKEEKDLEQYMHDTRIFLFLMIRRYFTFLGFRLGLHNNLELLKKEKFPKVDLQKIRDYEKTKFSVVQKHGQRVMREGYQLYEQMKALKNEAAALERAA